MNGLRTEVCGQQKQSNDPGNNQHNPQYANYWAPGGGPPPPHAPPFKRLSQIFFRALANQKLSLCQSVPIGFGRKLFFGASAPRGDGGGGTAASTAATTKPGARRASHQQTPPPSLYKVPTYSNRAGAAPRAPGGARHGGGNRAVTSQPRTGQSTSYGNVKSSYRGAGGWDRSGCATWAPRSATRQGEEQHTERGSHTRRDKGEHSRQGGGAQQGRRGNQNSGNREPEWRG